MNYVHLHTHSHYSLLDGLSKIEDIISRTKSLGMDAIALTDHGNMYGAIEFYQAAQKEGIKPILGMEAYIAPGSMKERKAINESVYHHLVLLAKSHEGYKNLMKLSSLGFLEGYYYKPRIDKEALREYGKDIIATSGCLGGEIQRALAKSNDLEEAKKIAYEYLSIFGEGNFFLELQDHLEHKEIAAVNEKLLALSKETSIPLVVTRDSHYIDHSDQEAHEVLLCVATGKTMEDENRFSMAEVDASLNGPQDIAQRFSHVPEALENTVKIAQQCNVEIDLDTWYFPPVEKAQGKEHIDMLRDNAYQGCEELLGEVSDEYRKRIEYELGIIEQKGYAEYFLAVADYAAWSHEQGIVVTTRGSAAGSFVSYCTGIVSVNPLTYQLPFERFLNPFRPSAPDIDFDVQDDRREELIAHVTEKYGKENVAQICTFGTMAARASVKDVGRALGYPYSFCDEIAKAIPMGSQGFPMTIDHALELSEELKNKYETDPQVKRLIELAKRLEGCVRHSSVHAAGVVISPTPLTDHTPVQREPGGGDRLVTQYEMHAVGEDGVGLLKHDLLGIRNLSILGNAIQLVKKTKGVDIDLQKIPLDDKKTFEMLTSGRTIGVFQMGGSGMTKYLMELKPEKVEDLMMMVALYRPGPIDNIAEYIARKEGRKKTVYYHPKMETFLQKSFGVLVYQDDLLYTAIEVAGYDWEQVDKFRKAVGKKIPEEMAKQHEIFVSGCMKTSGMSKDEAEGLWKLFEPFQGYGFNKAHACSYGMVSYQTAYMKANFPAEYMASILTAESNDLLKVAEVVKECGKMGIEVLPPDINESFDNFTYVDDTHIRFGLRAIKNVGSDIVASLIAQRKENGHFTSLENLVVRIQTKSFNKKSLESLAKSGALDSLSERNLIIENIERILNASRQIQRERTTQQSSLFGVSPGAPVIHLALAPVQAASNQQRLAWEKELLGLYVSAHPLNEYAEKISAFVPSCKQVLKKTEAEKVLAGGIIATVKTIRTKKGDEMAFFTLEDLEASIECVVFPGVFAKRKHLLVSGNVVLVIGKISLRDGKTSIMIDEIEKIDLENCEFVAKRMSGRARPSNGSFVTRQMTERSSAFGDRPSTSLDERSVSDGAYTTPCVIIHFSQQSQEKSKQLKEILAQNHGNFPVQLLMQSENSQKYIAIPYTIAFSDEVKRTIEVCTGKNTVMLRQ